MDMSKTAIGIVLDRSGSMADRVDDVIGGVNNFLQNQREQPGKCLITLCQFDTVYEVVYESTPIENVAPRNKGNYIPRGGTALLDAIGQTIDSMGKSFAAMHEWNRPGKVILVIVTDGEENASIKYSRPMIMDMIRHQETNYKWEVIYIGANQDAIKSGSSIGIKLGNSINYAHSDIGYANTFSMLSEKTSNYRSGKSANMMFDENDRKIAMGESCDSSKGI